MWTQRYPNNPSKIRTDSQGVLIAATIVCSCNCSSGYTENLVLRSKVKKYNGCALFCLLLHVVCMVACSMYDYM